MRRRSQMVAILASAAVIPRTFQQSLLPRSTSDQGLVTGITIAMVYMMGLLVQDGVDIASDSITHSKDDQATVSTKAILASATAVGIGYLLQKKFKYDKSEQLPKSATRTSGYWLQNVGIAGVLVSALEFANESLSSDKEKSKDRELLPYIVGAGIIFSLVGEYSRTKNDENHSVKEVLKESKPLRVLAMSTAVIGALGTFAYIEKTIAKGIDATLDKTAPSLKKSYMPIGHIIGAGSLVYALTLFMKKTYGDIEQKAGELEYAYEKSPTNDYVSGGKGSNVDWGTLSIQGRRHIGTRLTATKIKSVIKKPSEEPIRIYIGLDSADTEEARVDLALSELERTGAYKKKNIIVTSPTGTGYVNYVMSDAVEYLSKGSVASVTIQYSKRPSPMSLDRVGEGHKQYRMLLNGINKKINTLPKTKQPKVMLFGESLGAWTSQDALMYGGTDTLKALNIHRALWIGTPKGSKWKEQVSSKKWLNIDSELVDTFDNYQEYMDLSQSAKNKLRYVMVTHHNDPIAQFGAETLIKQPEWVDEPDKRPKSLSPSVKYRTPTLFVQTLIDMKNALKPEPGKFVASAHDYRADIAQFASSVYGFKASAEELESIEKALRQNEIQRAKDLELSKSAKDK